MRASGIMGELSNYRAKIDLLSGGKSKREAPPFPKSSSSNTVFEINVRIIRYPYYLDPTDILQYLGN